MVRDALYTDYPYADTKDHIVLDLGAHIGAFTKRALDGGAKKVICVEPWSPNLELLRRNHGANRKVTILPIACASTETITLTVPNERDTGAVSAFVKHRVPSRTEVVPAMTLEAIVKQHKPTFVKMDIEAAEWDVLPCDLTGVRDICGELHTMSRGNRQSAFQLLAWLEAQGFYITHLEGGPKRDRMFERLLWMHFHAHKKSKD